MVTLPARNQVPVQVSWYTGSCHTPEIQTDVKTFGLDARLQQICQLPQFVHGFQMFVGSQFVQRPNVAVRCQEYVSVIVRESIQNDENVIAPPDNQVLTIGLLRIDIVCSCSAKETGVFCPRVPPGRFETIARWVAWNFACDVVVTPWCPKSLLIHYRLSHWRLSSIS